MLIFFFEQKTAYELRIIDWSSDVCSSDHASAMASVDAHRFHVRTEPALPIDVERTKAGFASWYELFPRSQAALPVFGAPRHGTFDDVIARLPALRAMGFDVDRQSVV